MLTLHEWALLITVFQSTSSNCNTPLGPITAPHSLASCLQVGAPSVFAQLLYENPNLTLPLLNPLHEFSQELLICFLISTLT